MGIYLNLYTSKKSQSATTEKFLQNLNLSKVSAEHRNYIEQPITETEILQTVKKKKPLKTNKSSGPDRYKTEFYKQYANLLCAPVESLQLYPHNEDSSYFLVQNNNYHNSKHNKDETQQASSRSVSLLNVECRHQKFYCNIGS